MSATAAHTIGEIAARVGGEIEGTPESAGVPITGAQSIDEAGPGEITFVTDAAHARSWSESRAAAALISQRARSAVPATDDGAKRRPLIIVPDAELALIDVLELFQPPPPLPENGVHPAAFVHPNAELAAGVRIGPHVSIDRGAVIGAQVVLHAGVRVYADVTIGENSVIHANTVIRERCVIGERVIIHQNASIGADGFGYRPASLEGGGITLRKMPHLGYVRIESDVEIGAGTCVDRGKFGATVIGAGTKIDNLVQIGHNCRIGRSCVFAGMSGLAGSVVVGDGVQVGAQVGVEEQTRIGSGARIAAQSGVMKDVPPGETVGGTPAYPAREALRQVAALRKLPGLLDRLKG